MVGVVIMGLKAQSPMSPLVLQACIHEIKVTVASLEWCGIFRVVIKLGHPARSNQINMLFYSKCSLLSLHGICCEWERKKGKV